MRDLQLKFISNAVTIRWLRILNVIEREQNFTIVNLSERLEVSQRTLITDIGYLKLHFEQSPCFTYQSNRYTFRETDRMLYQEQKQALLADEVLFEIIGIFSMESLRRSLSWPTTICIQKAPYGAFWFWHKKH